MEFLSNESRVRLRNRSIIGKRFRRSDVNSPIVKNSLSVYIYSVTPLFAVA